MDEAAIAQLFEQAIRAIGQTVDRRLGHGNEYAIPDMARTAAHRIVTQAQDDSERDALVLQGHEAFARLGREMVRAAEQIPGYPTDIIGEQTLSAALNALGPWPPIW